MVTDIRIIVPTALPSGPNVIWETNFSSDSSYTATNEASETVNVPTGTDIIKATGASVLHGVAGAGEGGSVAMRFEYAAKGESTGDAPVMTIGKHLTQTTTGGYPELYIRYKVKLPNGFKYGDGTNALTYWKFFRLWQNTEWPPANWTENRSDSFYFVCTATGNPSVNTGNRFTMTCGATSAQSDDYARIGGSNNGSRAGVDWFKSGGNFLTQDGYFESMNDGDWGGDWVSAPPDKGLLTDNTTQGWHTIEFRAKLASSTTAQDGIFEMWFDGVKQADWLDIDEGSTSRVRYGIITNTSQDNPCVVTMKSDETDDFQTGDVVDIDLLNIGMVELNNRTFTITRINSTSFSLDGEDATGHTAWSASETNAAVSLWTAAGFFTGIPTAVEGGGAGFNWIGIMDNMAGWNEDWADAGIEGWIDFSDIVVATTPIGHNYIVTGDGS